MLKHQNDFGFVIKKEREEEGGGGECEKDGNASLSLIKSEGIKVIYLFCSHSILGVVCVFV